MQHAMATKMTNIWHYAERHEQWKRVTLPACILKMYCRPGATAENMIQPITGLQSLSIPVRRFPKKLHRSTYLYIYVFPFFIHKPLPGGPNHVWTKILAYIRRSGWVWSISGNIYRQTTLFYWNEVVTRRCRNLHLSSHRGPNVHTPFAWDEPWTFAHVLYTPLPNECLTICFVSFFRNLNFGLP